MSTDRLVVDVVGVRVEVLAADLDESLPAALGAITVTVSAGDVVDCSVKIEDEAGWGPADAAEDVPGDAVLDANIEGLLGAAARAAIEHSTDLLVHASAVARDGRAILFPGASGTGKSTIAAACLRRGFGYLTDEMIALDFTSGQVRGWARPVMLTPWSVRAVGLEPRTRTVKEAVLPDRLGASVVTGLIPVEHVVLVRRGAPESALTSLGAGELLSELLTSSFNHYRFGASAWEAVVALVSSVSGWRLDVADVDSAADLVAGLPGAPEADPGG